MVYSRVFKYYSPPQTPVYLLRQAFVAADDVHVSCHVVDSILQGLLLVNMRSSAFPSHVLLLMTVVGVCNFHNCCQDGKHPAAAFLNTWLPDEFQQTWHCDPKDHQHRHGHDSNNDGSPTIV